MQSDDKGFRYVVIDDSPELGGICQRMHPAFPTIPVIMRSDVYYVGDRFEWFYRPNLSIASLQVEMVKKRVKGIVKRAIGRQSRHTPNTKIDDFETDHAHG